MQRYWRRTVWYMIPLLAVSSLVLGLGCGGGGSDGGDDNADDSPPVTNAAFILTTDFSTGSYSVVDLASRTTFNDITLGGTHSDAIARAFNGRVYVVNRGADNIQLLDPQRGYTTPSGAQLSVGDGSNPQDIAFVSAEKAYVSRLDSSRLLIINPTTFASRGEVDLGRLVKPADLDGAPETAYMLVHNGLLYVALQHLDFSAGGIPAKVAPGEVVVLNPTTDTIVAVIVLRGTNPVSELQYSPALNRILVSTVGDFTVNDGGIEAIDPATNTVVGTFIIDEARLGGDVTHFQVISATKGYAIVSDSNFANTLVSFNPSNGARLAALTGPIDAFVPHFAVNRRNELYLAVADPTTATPGVRLFNTATDTELTTTPLNVGDLLPLYILFLE